MPKHFLIVFLAKICREVFRPSGLSTGASGMGPIAAMNIWNLLSAKYFSCYFQTCFANVVPLLGLCLQLFSSYFKLCVAEPKFYTYTCNITSAAASSHPGSSSGTDRTPYVGCGLSFFKLRRLLPLLSFTCSQDPRRRLNFIQYFMPDTLLDLSTSGPSYCHIRSQNLNTFLYGHPSTSVVEFAPWRVCSCKKYT